MSALMPVRIIVLRWLAVLLLATDRAAAAKTERAAARKAAGRLQQRADRTLATAPAVPGDACKSMQKLGDDWLRERQ